MGQDQDHASSCKQPVNALSAHLVSALLVLWRSYLRKLKRCQRHFGEESVHELRVATRRLLAKLDLLGALIPDEHLEKALSLLKKRLDAFDDLRDTQVQILYADKRRRGFPELRVFLADLQRREQRLIKSTAKAVKRVRTAKLATSMELVKQRLKRWCADSVTDPRSLAVIRNVVQEAFDRVVDRRRRMDPTDLTTIHRTRVAFKQFRYLVETLRPMLPEVRPKQIQAMRLYQTLMGNIQDLQVLLDRMDKLLLKKKVAVEYLLPFRQELVRRRSMLVDKYLQSADRLFTFWPGSKPPARPTLTA